MLFNEKEISNDSYDFKTKFTQELHMAVVPMMGSYHPIAPNFTFQLSYFLSVPVLIQSNLFTQDIFGTGSICKNSILKQAIDPSHNDMLESEERDVIPC